MKLSASVLLLLGWSVAYAEPALSVPAGKGKTHESDSTKPVLGPPTDSFMISGQLDHFSSGNGGGGGSLDWVHSTPQGTTLTAGIASFSIANSRWALGRVGAAFRPRERMVAHAQASLGSGQTGGSSFPYQLFDGGLIYKTLTRLFLKLEDQYVHVGETRGNLPKAGVVFLPAHRLSVDLTYARSAGGNLDTEFSSGRLDFNARPARCFGGGAVGRATSQIFNVRVGSQAMSEDLKEAFVGLAVPFSRSELSVVADFLNSGTLRKRTLTFSLKVFLRKP